VELRRAIELARACELAMRAAYEDVARLTEGADPALVDLWERMALVESQHAEVFDDILAALPEAAGRAEVRVSPRYLEIMIDALLAFRQRLTRVAVSLDEIFGFVLDMELGEQIGVLRELLAQTDGALGRDGSPVAVSLPAHDLTPIFAAILRWSDDATLRARAEAAQRAHAQSPD